MKNLKRVQRLLLVLCLGFLIAVAGRSMRLAASEVTSTPEPTPEPTPAPVKVKSINYEELWLVVDAVDNDTVYYSDKGKKVWSEAVKPATGTEYSIDISWIKATASGEINLKGDKNEEIVTVTLPARESKYKVKFDKAKGTLIFSNLPSGVEKFQWRKATSYEWTEVPIKDAEDVNSDFWEELNKFRISGASIYVRISGEDGKAGTGEDSSFDVGKRPGKEIKLSITKRANAPKIKINGSKLTLNTTTAMQYSVDNGKNWETASKNMPLATVAKDALGDNAQSVTVWFRKAAKNNTPYSKTFVLEVPAQPGAPSSSEFSSKVENGKFCLTFAQASKTTPYEYAVVKPGIVYSAANVSWKSVTASKTISLSSKTVPENSKIYIRKKTIKQTSSTNFALASMEAVVEVHYPAPTSTPVPTSKP